MMNFSDNSDDRENAVSGNCSHNRMNLPGIEMAHIPLICHDPDKHPLDFLIHNNSRPFYEPSSSVLTQ